MRVTTLASTEIIVLLKNQDYIYELEHMEIVDGVLQPG